MYTLTNISYTMYGRVFCELFPELVELHETKKREGEALAGSSKNALNPNNSSSGLLEAGNPAMNAMLPSLASWSAVIGILVAIVACVWAIVALSL